MHSEAEAAGRVERRRNTVYVLGLSLILRLLVMWHVTAHLPKGWLYTRGVEMRFLADSLLQGKGLSSPFGVPTGPTAMIAPAYPLFLAAIFRMFGSESTASATVVMGMQILLNLLTIWLLMRLARRFVEERSAVAVGVLWACSPALIWMSTILWETSFSACLLTALVLVAVEFEERSSWIRWSASGCLCGVAGLVNPALIPSMSVMAAFMMGTTSGKDCRKLGVAIVLAVLTFSPWPIRNARVFHAFIPMRTTVGFELWMGNRPGATGYLDQDVFPMYNSGELADYKAKGEVLYFAEKGRAARRFILAQPWVFVRMTLLRVVRFWSGTGNKEGSMFFLLHAMATTILGGTGLVLLWRAGQRHVGRMILIPLVIFPLPYYGTHAEFRYRLVIDPMLTAMAAVAISSLAKWLAAVCSRRRVPLRN